MPDKPLFHPNERVDLVDMTHASAGYTDARARFDTVKQLLGKRARLIEGFRVEIVDQAVSPGQISVHNGNALDATGRHLNNEDQVNDTRDVTLLGATQVYFLEIEYREAESATDSKGFWDPSFDNVAPELDGKEFNLTATTRITPNWQVVTPVSTTGFDIETNPDSTRIPLAVLSTTAGGLIDESGVTLPGSAFTKVVVSGVLEEDLALGVTEIRLLDSRQFGTAGTIDIDFGGTPETLAFISNDFDTGILSLGAPTGALHQAGEIVRINGSAATFIEQRTGAVPTIAGSSGPDVARRLFQGDETRGSALVSSKETFGGRDDLNIKTIKDMHDSYAALVREMKFGALRPDQTDATLPTAFTSTRYYDSVGGLAGARSAAVTIGDGINTLGDFNGTDQAPFQAALDFLAAHPAGAEATIVVKAGTYTFTAAVTEATTSRVSWVGEGTVSLVMDSATDSMFNMTNAVESRFVNFDFTKTGVNTEILTIADLDFFLLERCTVTSGSMLLTGIGGSTIRVIDCVINSTAVTAGVKVFTADNFSRVEVSRCEVNVDAGSDGMLFDNSTTVFSMQDTTILIDGTTTTALELGGTTHILVSLTNVGITGTAGANCFKTPDSNTITALTMDSCILTMDTLDGAHRSAVQLGMFGVANIRSCLFAGDVTTPSTQGLFSWGFADTGSASFDLPVTFQNCLFITNTPASAGKCIFTENDATFVDRYSVSLRDCTFTGGFIQVEVHRNGSLLVDNCVLDGGGAAGNTVVGIKAGCMATVAGSSQDITIRDSKFRDISSELVASLSHTAIDIEGPGAGTNTATNLNISGNIIERIGNVTTSQLSLGITVLATTPIGSCSIVNNRIRNVDVTAGGIIGGIGLSGFRSGVLAFADAEFSIKDNNISFIGEAGNAYSVSAGISVNPGGLGTGVLNHADISHNIVRFLFDSSVSLGGIYVAFGDNSSNINIAYNKLVSTGSIAATALGGGAITVDVNGIVANLSITNNDIDTTVFTSVTPIVVNITTVSLHRGIHIDNNHMASHSGAYSISVVGFTTGPGVASQVQGLSVSNNVMGGMSQVYSAFAHGFITVSLVTGFGVTIDGNSMVETAANATRYGIFLNSTTVTPGDPTSGGSLSGVSVSNNHITMASGTARTVYPLIVSSIRSFKVAGNFTGTVTQNNGLTDMGGIFVDDSAFGYVTGNITITNPGTLFAVNIATTCDNVMTAWNLLTVDQTASGVVNIAGGTANHGTGALASAIGDTNISRLS